MAERIMITHSGAPNGEAIARSIRKFHPSTILIGTDCDPLAPNRWMYDRFCVSERDDAGNYISSIHSISKSCDWILPLNGNNAAEIKKSKPLGEKCLSSDRNTILSVLNKHNVYERFNVPHKVASGQSLMPIMTNMHDGRPLVVKPLEGKGSRGVFVICDVDDFAMRNVNKPGFLHMSWMRFIQMFCSSSYYGDVDKKWIVMPYYPGPEYFVNCLCDGGDVLWTQVIRVMDKRDNVFSLGRVVHNTHLEMRARDICNEYGFSYWVNLQFIDKNLIEINPRISSWIASERYSVPYLAVRLANGERVDEKKYPPPKEGTLGQRVFCMHYEGR